MIKEFLIIAFIIVAIAGQVKCEWDYEPMKEYKFYKDNGEWVRK